jgi:hypothetical protein
MKTFLTIIFCLIATTVFGSPFLVCDPQAGVTHYEMTGMPWTPTALIPAETNGSIRYDVSASTVGANTIQLKACRVDTLWGQVCSTATPFTFTRPSLSTGAPNQPRLVP